ncbi:MAG: GNAT family N-acetyltransferase [Spirochaetes bacterium]|nr:GNAT family N-acetyltransferase [Spirochaetota bacterium]
MNAHGKTGMGDRFFPLKDGLQLQIRKAAIDDAADLIAFVQAVSGESANLTFGPGEFAMTMTQEEDYLKGIATADNQLYLVGLVDSEIVASLNFASGKRPRIRHAGVFGISVRRQYWGLDVGGAMLDALVEWARASGSIKKISLRVRTDNERAIRLYAKKGFKTKGRLRAEFKIGEKYYDLYAMRLMLF